MAAVTNPDTKLDVGPGRPVVEIIRDLRSGVITGRALDGESRRACVMYLGGEGYGVPEIAALLKVSDRTVARDRARMREELAVERDPGLLPRMVGHLIGEAESTSVRLRRIARDKSAPASARVEAEKATWGIACDLVRTLQSVGYLPQAPRPVRVSARVEGVGGEEGDFDAPALEELINELARIEAIASASGNALPASDATSAAGITNGSSVSGGEQQPTELAALRLDLGRLAVAARMSAIERMIAPLHRTDSDDETDDDGPDTRTDGTPERSSHRAQAPARAEDRTTTRTQASQEPKAAPRRNTADRSARRDRRAG